ncbi:hypothetical protein EFY79_11625 [Hanamia caeni]|uniref:Uncharacterized protein n=1 Tax=Hanamia caeni TaxID=2294116 RepID=A0A3M9NEH4_9BACT|nr:hypothetical protein EFY79_11625 [Hanamia caeni]
MVCLFALRPFDLIFSSVTKGIVAIKNVLLSLALIGDAQRPRIYAGMELEFLSARTVAKFIIKSSLLFLSLNKVPSARNCC